MITHAQDKISSRVDARLLRGTFALFAISLAACNEVAETTQTVTPTVPITDDGAPAESTVYVYDDNDSGPVLDATDLTGFTQIVVRNTNGDVTLNDLQSTTNDAASGAAGTTYRLEDVSQNTSGTILLNFDAQAVDDSVTVIDLFLDEVAGSVAITGGSVETLNVILDESDAAESSALDALSVQDITVLNVSGGAAGHSFTIRNSLDTSLTTLGAGSTASDLWLDLSGSSAAQSGTYALGSGNDRLVLADGYGSDEVITDAGGADTLSLELSSATIRAGSISGIETLDVVFAAPATFDAVNVSGLTTINMGLDADGAALQSGADADFNRLGAEVTNLNIYATQADIELDYASGAAAQLSVNFENASGAVTVGNSGPNPESLTFIDVKDLTINQNVANSATVVGTSDLSGDTETLHINTTAETGDLRMGELSTATVFSGTAALRTLSLSAVNGDIGLHTGATQPGAGFIQDVSSLQDYSVYGDDGRLDIGTLGAGSAAGELETISITSVDGGVINQEAIDASGADIARMTVQSSDNNTIPTFGGAGPNANVYLSGLTADNVRDLNINADDGGLVFLTFQSYTLHSLTIQGSGTVGLLGGAGGLRQLGPAAAGNHTGDRTFADGDGDDVLYGSNAADNIIFFGQNSSDVYNDAGGNDRIELRGDYDGNLLTVNDGAAGTDDTYDMTSNSISTGAPGPAGGEITFNVGSGQDDLNLSSGFNGDVDIDFGTWISGQVTITNFRAGGAGETLSFDGLSGITSNMVNAPITGSVAVTSLNDNSIYLIDDGDIAVTGTTGGAFDGVSIADYTNLSDVANYLNAVTDGSAGSNNSAVFLVENGPAVANVGANSHDIYIYLFNDDGSGSGIQTGEIQLLGTIDMSGGTPITATDIV